MKCLVCDFILETICSSMIFIFYFIRILFMIYCYAIVNGVFKVCNGIFLFYDLCMYRNILRCISVHVINELDFTCFVGMESESEFTGKYSELS